jgi:hypothetical protein
MRTVLEGISKGIKLILQADPEVVEITLLTLRVLDSHC